MGMCEKYLRDLIQAFTDIRALKVVTIYFNENNSYGQKTVVTVEPETIHNKFGLQNWLLGSLH